ncbi:MAG TPA: hypothetical protein VEI02_08460 [Planctomycetota bacterium]|nr:hypothetical protein [Planctomycetota bacterium]
MPETLYFWDLQASQYAAYCTAIHCDLAFPAFRLKHESDAVWARRAGFTVVQVKAEVDEVVATMMALGVDNDAPGRAAALREIAARRTGAAR